MDVLLFLALVSGKRRLQTNKAPHPKRMRLCENGKRGFHVNDCSNFPEFLNKIHAISFKYYYNFNPFKIFSSLCVLS